jgi:hypothetical protein
MQRLQATGMERPLTGMPANLHLERRGEPGVQGEIVLLHQLVFEIQWILGVMYLLGLLQDGSMNSSCAQGDPQNGRNCHYSIGEGGCRWNWSYDHLRCNIRNWKGVHLSYEIRFLLRPLRGRVWVWRHRNTAFHDGNVMGTTAFDGGAVTIWGAFLLILC